MEKQDKNALLFLIFTVLGFIAMVYWLGSEYGGFAVDWFNQTFNSGLGFKPAVAIAFILTVVVMVVLAMVSDGGILGEVQYLLGSFFFFFIVFAFLLAWIF